MKRFLHITILMVAVLAFQGVYGQKGRKVQGMLRDSQSRPVAGASVMLISEKDSVGTSSERDGIVSCEGVKSDSYKIRVASIGYEANEKDFSFPDGEEAISTPSFVVKNIPNVLQEVIVDGVLTV